MSGFFVSFLLDTIKASCYGGWAFCPTRLRVKRTFDIDREESGARREGSFFHLEEWRSRREICKEQDPIYESPQHFKQQEPQQHVADKPMDFGGAMT